MPDAVDGADEFAIPLAAVLVFVGMALAVLYVVWIAPVLFAELVVDGVLSLARYRRLHRQPRRHWLESALRRTWLPFAPTAALFLLVGLALGWVAPGARSLGEVEHPSPGATQAGVDPAR
ncbi:MAG: hypothetical protein KDH15_14250 [Rhodocyclaceae bacterium]|nr:hypothetical protein [Rhodocyclaceae bacterium]